MTLRAQILGSFFIKEETFEKCSILFKAKEGENFNHRNTWSILRINPPKFGGGLKFEPDAGIGQKGTFCKGLERLRCWQYQILLKNRTFCWR